MEPMMNDTLAAQMRTKSPKFGHYVGEFATPGIGHLLASAGCEFVFFDMEHYGFGFETLNRFFGILRRLIFR